MGVHPPGTRNRAGQAESGRPGGPHPCCLILSFSGVFPETQSVEASSLLSEIEAQTCVHALLPPGQRRAQCLLAGTDWTLANGGPCTSAAPASGARKAAGMSPCVTNSSPGQE